MDKLEALITHFLHEAPADDWETFILQGAKARYLHEITFNTLKVGVNHGMAGKQ